MKITGRKARVQLVRGSGIFSEQEEQIFFDTFDLVYENAVALEILLEILEISRAITLAFDWITLMGRDGN